MKTHDPENALLQDHLWPCQAIPQDNSLITQQSKNSIITKAYYSIVNNLTGLFTKLPDNFNSAILIDYSHSPERKALEIHKLLHPVICVSLEAEMDDNLDHHIYYAINESFKRRFKASFYKEVRKIIAKLTVNKQIEFNVVELFYSDCELDEIARYKLIGPNAYITITDQLEYS